MSLDFASACAGQVSSIKLAEPLNREELQSKYEKVKEWSCSLHEGRKAGMLAFMGSDGNITTISLESVLVELKGLKEELVRLKQSHEEMGRQLVALRK